MATTIKSILILLVTSIIYYMLEGDMDPDDSIIRSSEERSGESRAGKSD